MDGDHGRINIRSAAVSAIAPVDAGLLSAGSSVKAHREWLAKTEQESEARVHIWHFISSLPPDNPAELGSAVRGHWSVETATTTSATTPSGRKTGTGALPRTSH